MIVDCSQPKGSSVNTYVNKVSDKFRYNSVDTVPELLQQNNLFTITDLKDVYRALSIHPKDRQRQGLSWKFENSTNITYLRDNRLCMGLASAPFIFV